VGVQVGEHAGDGIGDEFLVLHRLDVALLDRRVHLGKGAQLLDGQAFLARLVGQGGEIEAQQRAGNEAARDQSRRFPPLAADLTVAICLGDAVHLLLLTKIDPAQRVLGLPLITELKV